MAKYIDRNNYQPHYVDIPGMEEMPLIDLKAAPKLFSNEEHEAFLAWLEETRRETAPRRESNEPCAK